MSRINSKSRDKLTDKDFLEQEYLVKNRTKDDLSRELGVSPSTLQRALRRLGIKKSGEQSFELRKKGMLDKYGVEFPIHNPEFNLKIKNTNLEKYGADNPLKNSDVMNKARKTCLERYGVPTPFHSEKFQNKGKKTRLERYGFEDAMCSDSVRKKQSETIKEIYGVSNAFKSPIIKKKIRKVLLEKYNVDNPSKSEFFKRKRAKTMMHRHGVSYYLKHPSFYFKSFQSKVESGNIHLLEGKTLREIAEENNFSYTSVHYYYSNYNFEKIDDLVYILRNSSENKTWIESKIISEFGFEFWNKKACNSLSYRPDFKISLDVYLNVDGLYWHSELNIPNKKHHMVMRESFESHGLRLIQIREDEIKNKLSIVSSLISNATGKIERKIYARNTCVKSVDYSEACIFLSTNHMMGKTKARNIGLYLDDELVSILSYKMHGKILKIERFCSKNDCIVVGGLSKLLNYLSKNLKPKEIHSWVDLRYGDGHSLIDLGFKRVKDTLGWKWTDGRITYNRLRCRANMDNRRLSESDYAKELGWYKIYDAGQRFFKKLLNEDNLL